MLTYSWAHNLVIAGQPIFFLPWMTQSYTFKQKLQHCEPIDLSRFVVDLRERHLSTGHLILKLIRENTTANALLITNGVFFLQKVLWTLIRLTSFPIHVSQPAS